MQFSDSGRVQRTLPWGGVGASSSSCSAACSRGFPGGMRGAWYRYSSRDTWFRLQAHTRDWVMHPMSMHGLPACQAQAVHVAGFRGCRFACDSQSCQQPAAMAGTQRQRAQQTLSLRSIIDYAGIEPRQGALQVAELWGQGSRHSCVQPGRVQPVGVVAGDHLKQLRSAERCGDLFQAPRQHLQHSGVGDAACVLSSCLQGAHSGEVAGGNLESFPRWMQRPCTSETD